MTLATDGNRNPVPRKVDRLLWVKACNRPSILPKRKIHYRNVKAVGLRYEKSVYQAAKDLRWGATLHGQWFEFCDANGHGYCQPDVLIIQPSRVIILECKLTDVDEAWNQLEWLYIPVVRKLLQRETRGVIVTRYLTPTTNTARVYDSLDAALACVGMPILHWIGRGPIGHGNRGHFVPPIDSLSREYA